MQSNNTEEATEDECRDSSFRSNIRVTEQSFMESQEFIMNWRTHITNFKRAKQGNLTVEQYCRNERIDLCAFLFWQKYIDREDKFTFFQSFAPEYLRQAQKALELIDHYIDLDRNLRMPLMRDAIISYAVLFGRSKGRISHEWRLDAKTFVPRHLQDVHEKICTARDVIIAHCDLGPRNPRVTSFGIVLKGKGFYWEDYRALIPEFKELIQEVTSSLESYVVQERLSSAEEAFQDLNPDLEALKDPGRPKTVGETVPR